MSTNLSIFNGQGALSPVSEATEEDVGAITVANLIDDHSGYSDGDKIKFCVFTTGRTDGKITRIERDEQTSDPSTR